MSLVSGIDHVNLSTSKPEETIAFFTDVLGLENRPDQRPAFNTPGAWLFAGDSAIVHLNFVDETPGEPSGPLDHFAFTAADFDAVVARLDESGTEYRVVERPETGLRQAFLQEPNGVRVEINGRL